jgi:hypothetical protein
VTAPGGIQALTDSNPALFSNALNRGFGHSAAANVTNLLRSTIAGSKGTLLSDKILVNKQEQVLCHSFAEVGQYLHDLLVWPVVQSGLSSMPLRP